MKKYGMELIKDKILLNLPLLKDHSEVNNLSENKINPDALLKLILPISKTNYEDYEVLVKTIETYKVSC